MGGWRGGRNSFTKKFQQRVAYTDAEVFGELFQPDPVWYDERHHVALGGIAVHAAVLHIRAGLQFRFNLKIKDENIINLNQFLLTQKYVLVSQLMRAIPKPVS
jgi:hypothetical protein